MMTDDRATKYLAPNEDLVRALNLIEEWYADVLPRSLESHVFAEFAARSRTLAMRLAPLAPLHVSASAYTAYTDGESITLPSCYMADAFYEYLRIAPDDRILAAILLINGAQ